MATYAHGTESLPGPVPGQSMGFLDGCESQSTQETGYTSLELCKYEKRQSTEEEDRNRSLALIQRISERHLIQQQELRNQPRVRELQQYLGVLQDAIPRLPDNNLLPGPELPSATSSRPRLAYPIMIKQRLSRTSSPKFAATYPPDLQNCGIKEREFLRFLDDLNRVYRQPGSPGSPGDHAMDINGFANTTALTTSRPTLLSMVIRGASSYGKHTAKRSATSEILQKANNELFHPRGLACVLVACRRTESEASGKTPERGGAAASTYIPDRSQGKKLKMRQRIVGRMRGSRWTELEQFGFYDEEDFHPGPDSHRPPPRHSYRPIRRRSPSSEREDKIGLEQVIEEHCENGNIDEGRQRQSTSRCAKGKHLAWTENEISSLSRNKATNWDFVSNQSSNLALIPGKVKIESLPADFFTAETDEEKTCEEAQQTDAGSETASTIVEPIGSSQGETLSPNKLYLMILNSPEEVENLK
ncbi:hypothetical protein CFIO01_08873 [Colletotrichum fioriniae PJ7]|uniref:Uncharacterized protein n=1 Tax=Colletotrichum fioriniae PJ7 TaxID=1445577 RepID=A0A010RCJ3_9PEZI|nr:hypothetical protein CFIO01_08873 [Colletotrichum fioriniae PJ7]